MEDTSILAVSMYQYYIINSGDTGLWITQQRILITEWLAYSFIHFFFNQILIKAQKFVSQITQLVT